MDTPPSRPASKTRHTQPFEPDGRMPSDFATIGDFIASGAFDEAVLRAGKAGVERAVARQEALGLTGSTQG